MVFSSLVFLFLFLPVVLLTHRLLPAKAKNYALLIFNLIFYGYGEPIYLILMIASILVNYLLAWMVYFSKTAVLKKTVIIMTVVVNLSALGWFKYAELFADTLRSIGGFSSLPALSVVLPVGISFYTFQAMSYVIDVYREDCEPAKSIVDFATYISLFPQLIAGPIVRYCDVAAQLTVRSESLEKFSWGIKLFTIGLAKKVLLANQFALLWQSVSPDPGAYGTICAWVALAAYTLQIYFDFGGYSDMARGLGAMLGFDFCINFDYPYISSSITEFWRRWHISLSSWFRDYVYIPLGGSRKGKWRTAYNLLLVWMLTGFWHGAGWNFLLWGLYYGVLLLAEKFLLNKFLPQIPIFIRTLFTLLLVAVGWVFFACVDLSSSVVYLRTLFVPCGSQLSLPLLSWLPLLAVGAVAATPLGKRMWNTVAGKSWSVWVQAILCVLAWSLCTASLVSGSYNPFLYFRF